MFSANIEWNELNDVTLDIRLTIENTTLETEAFIMRLYKRWIADNSSQLDDKSIRINTISTY